MLNHSLAYEITNALQSYKGCRDRDPETQAHLAEWETKHFDQLKTLCQNGLPHGSGIDSTHPEELHGLSVDQSTETRLVFHVSFHHMNDVGYYDGWTEHRIVVTPTFTGFDVRISGRNRNDIKDYLAECYHCALSEIVDPMTGISVAYAEEKSHE